MTCPELLRFFVPNSIDPAKPDGVSFYPQGEVEYKIDEFDFERGEAAQIFPGGFYPDRSVEWSGDDTAANMPIYQGLMQWQQTNKVNGVVQLIPFYDFYRPQVDVDTIRTYYRVPSTANISETVLDGTVKRFVYWRASAGYLLFRFDYQGGDYFDYEARFYEGRTLLQTDE